VLAGNVAARRLLAAVFPIVRAVRDGPEITFTVDLTTGDHTSPPATTPSSRRPDPAIPSLTAGGPRRAAQPTVTVS
jgi:hypothetical protein